MSSSVRTRERWRTARLIAEAALIQGVGTPVQEIIGRLNTGTDEVSIAKMLSRDPLFTDAFVAVLKAGGVKSVKIPAQSPKCNPHADRFVKTIKYECLNNVVIFGERHLRFLIKEFVEHYMAERFHQGIGGQLIRNVGSTNDNGADGKVVHRSRLGGLLNFYYREAA